MGGRDVLYPRKKGVLLVNNGANSEPPSQEAVNAMLIKALGYLPPPIVYHSAATPESSKTQVTDENMHSMLPSRTLEITPPSTPAMQPPKRKMPPPKTPANQTPKRIILIPKAKPQPAQDASAEIQSKPEAPSEFEQIVTAAFISATATPEASKILPKPNVAPSSVPVIRFVKKPIAKSKSEKAPRKPAAPRAKKPVNISLTEVISTETVTLVLDSPKTVAKAAFIEPSPSSMPAASEPLPMPSSDVTPTAIRTSRNKRRRTIYSPYCTPKRPKAVAKPSDQPIPGAQTTSDVAGTSVQTTSNVVLTPVPTSSNVALTPAQTTFDVVVTPKVEEFLHYTDTKESPKSSPTPAPLLSLKDVKPIRPILKDVAPIPPPSPSELALLKRELNASLQDQQRVEFFTPVSTKTGIKIPNSVPVIKTSPPITDNSCINSVLQGIFTVNGFSDALAEFVLKIQLKDKLAIDKMPLITSLSRLHRNRLSDSAASYFEAMLKCVRTVSPRFKNRSQKDAHEFIGEIFSQIQAEYDAAIKAVNGRRSQFASDPVTRFFGYMLRLRYTCRNRQCRNETIVQEKHAFLTVPIGEKRFDSESFGITDILKESLAEETVKHVCEKCNEKKAVLKKEIMQLPENLIFVIRRAVPKANDFNDSRPLPRMELEKSMEFVCDDEADELAIQGTERHSPCKKPHHPLQTFRVWVNDEKDNIMADFIGFRNYCNDEDDLPKEDELTPITTLHDSERIEAAFATFVRNVTQNDDAAVQVLNDLICDHLLEHKEAYAAWMGRNIKGFTEYVRRSTRGGHLAPSLQFYACGNIFKTVFVIQEGKKFLKFIPVVPMPFKKEIYLLDKSLNYFSRGPPTPDTEYFLNAVVSYLGSDTNGHYCCAVQRKPGKWYEYKDKAVKSVKERYALSNTASVAIYSKATDFDDESDTNSDASDSGSSNTD